MRGPAIVFACAALLAVGVLAPGCGRTDGSKKDGATDGKGVGGGSGGIGTGGASGDGGKGAGGVIATGGSPGAGGVIVTGGSPGAGGVSGTAGGLGATGGSGTGGFGAAGATGVDAPLARDTGSDGAGSERDMDVDRGASETRDVAVESVGIDGPLSIDLGASETATDKPRSEAASLTCAAAGGTCSPSRWQTCPKQYEPIGQETGHLDCPNSGWCCVPAPPSACSDSGAGNCVVGDTCTGCWSPAFNAPACETGRVCCVDMCD